MSEEGGGMSAFPELARMVDCKKTEMSSSLWMSLERRELDQIWPNKRSFSEIDEAQVVSDGKYTEYHGGPRTKQERKNFDFAY